MEAAFLHCSQSSTCEYHQGGISWTLSFHLWLATADAPMSKAISQPALQWSCFRGNAKRAALTRARTARIHTAEDGGTFTRLRMATFRKLQNAIYSESACSQYLKVTSRKETQHNITKKNKQNISSRCFFLFKWLTKKLNVIIFQHLQNWNYYVNKLYLKHNMNLIWEFTNVQVKDLMDKKYSKIWSWINEGVWASLTII